MTEPVQGLTQQLIHHAMDPFGLAIMTGVAATSFWLFGSLSLAIDGAFPAVSTQSERAKRNISETSALKMWEWASTRARMHFGRVGTLGGIAFWVASAFRPDLRPLLLGATFFAFSAIPYTVAVLMPMNLNILKILNDALEHDGKPPEPEQVDKHFDEWRKYNNIKIWLAAMTWILGTSALLLA